MLEHKGIEAKRADLPNVVCRPVLRAAGFPGPTVSPNRRNRSDFAEFFEGPLLGLPPNVAVACAAPLLAALISEG